MNNFTTITATSAQDFVSQLFAFEGKLRASNAEVLAYRVPQFDNRGVLIGSLSDDSVLDPQESRRQMVQWFNAFGSPMQMQVKVTTLDGKVGDWQALA